MLKINESKISSACAGYWAGQAFTDQAAGKVSENSILKA